MFVPFISSPEISSGSIDREKITLHMLTTPRNGKICHLLTYDIIDSCRHPAFSQGSLSPDFRVVPLKAPLQPPFSDALRVERREKGVQLQIEEKVVSRTSTVVFWSNDIEGAQNLHKILTHH